MIHRQARVSIENCLRQPDLRRSLQFLYGELWQLDALCRMLGLQPLAEMLEEAREGVEG